MTQPNKQLQVKSSNKISLDTDKNSLVIYPKQKDLLINKESLILELNDFKKAIENTVTIPVVVAIISLWSPLFTSDFKSLFGFSKDMILGGYSIFCIILSIVIIKPFYISFIRFFLLFPKLRILCMPWVEKNEIDPKQKVEIIVKKCSNK